MKKPKSFNLMSKIAYLFAGQGSQYIGMGHDLYEAFPESRAVFDKADKTLGFSLSKICFEGNPEVLKATIISQPAILTVSIAAYEAFKAKVEVKVKEQPSFMVGLSLGEYSALIAAGSLTFENGLRLVRRRAEIMEEATHKYPGKMCAVLDLPYEKLKDICRDCGAEIANLNAPGQIVISGRREAIDKAKDLSIQAGAKRVIELDVSGAFHSSLMSGASEELKIVLGNTPISDAKVAVISNYTASVQTKPLEISTNLVFQVRSSVRWEESMRFLLKQGVDKFYEFGPGKVLKGLMRRIDPAAQVVSVEKKEDILNLLQ